MVLPGEGTVSTFNDFLRRIFGDAKCGVMVFHRARPIEKFPGVYIRLSRTGRGPGKKGAGAVCASPFGVLGG